MELHHEELWLGRFDAVLAVQPTLHRSPPPPIPLHARATAADADPSTACTTPTACNQSRTSIGSAFDALVTAQLSKEFAWADDHAARREKERQYKKDSPLGSLASFPHSTL